MTEKVKRSKKSWRSIVDAADPDRKKPKVTYIFSSGRKFRDRGNVKYT